MANNVYFRCLSCWSLHTAFFALGFVQVFLPILIFSCSCVVTSPSGSFAETESNRKNGKLLLIFFIFFYLFMTWNFDYGHPCPLGLEVAYYFPLSLPVKDRQFLRKSKKKEKDIWFQRIILVSLKLSSLFTLCFSIHINYDLDVQNHLLMCSLSTLRGS